MVIEPDFYNYEDSTLVIAQDYVYNQDTAKAIGDAVIKPIVGEDIFSTMKLRDISYDEAIESWRVQWEYTKENETKIETYMCVIREDNGVVYVRGEPNDRDYVDDYITAQTIGDAVIKSLVGEETFEALNEVGIWYDPTNQRWTIIRYIGGDTIGGGFSCAINQADGKLKVWRGE